MSFLKKPVRPAAAPSSDKKGEIPPLYSGAARLLDWKNTARGGMTVDLGLRETGPLGVHPFKGMNCGKEHGQRLRLIVRPPTVDDPESVTPLYSGEVLLMRWSDDSISGMFARFLLDGGPDGTNGTHPFEGMNAGRKDGEAIEAIAWAIGDDESTQHPGHVRRRTPFFELSEVKQSQILCRDARFVSFLANNEAQLLHGEIVDPRPDASPGEFAGAVVKTYLGVHSRAVLGHETAEAEIARRRWLSLMNEYFRSEWHRN